MLVESSEAISKLIAQSVAQICLGTPKGARLSKMVIEHLIEKNSLTKPTAEVLVATMKILQVSTVSDDNSSGGSNRQDLLDHIGHHFILRNIKTNSAVREVLEREHRKQIDPLSDCSVDRIVPELIHIIAKSVESPSKETASVLNASLVAILRQSLAEGKTSSEGVDLVVSEVTKALIDLVNEDESGESKGSSSSTRAGKMRTDQRIEEICSRLGLSWRQSLLNGGGPEQRAHEFFGRVLASVGREMFTFPKSTIPLTLLGAIVGDSQSYEDVGEKGKPEQVALGRWKRDVILNAARSVLELSVKGMNDLHEKREEGTPDEVFSRLAPLLLLRRIPPSLFRAAYAEWFRQENYRNTSLAKVLSRVANHLAARLDIKVDKSLFMKNSELNFTAEERQMAAEVAGRCLPFNNSSDVYSASTEQPPLDFQLYGFSCFQAICLPGLVEMSDILLKAEISCDHEEIRSAIRRARASIYATCHFIPFSKHFDDESIGKPLLAIASFCLQFLNTEQATFESTDLEQDWLQLQAGCIEFFAVCLQRRLSLCHSDEMETADSVASLGACFEDMHSTIVEIIRSTDTVPKTIRRVNRWLQECLPVDLKEKIGRIEAFSVPCRTCLWNSLIILSQRCNEGSNLQLWAKSTLAWLVTWSASGETQSEQHPLCLTAALQLAFILITCTKSFVGLASSDIQNLHRWAVRSIQDSKGCTDYANNSLRCAGLKLLLAVVTIGQLSDSDSENYNPSALVFSRRDLEETSRLIHGISKQDPDPKLQTLALHILSSGLFIC